MEDKAVRGIPWMLLGYATNKGIRVASTVLLASLVAPADFGLIALAALTLAAINIVGGLGLGGVLVVRQELDARAMGTVFTLMAASGAAGAALVAAVSPLAAQVFGEPRLTAVLLVLAALVLVRVVVWFYEMVMQRELEFQRAFVGGVIGTVTYAATALVVAALDGGVWSLVAGELASASISLLALLALAPYRVRPAFDREVVRSVMPEARGFLAQGGLAFVQSNVDFFAVGRALGAAPLGFYSMAYRIAEVPYWAIANPVASVTFPGFARMQHRGEDVVPTFLRTLQLVALVTCPLGVILSAAAEPFTRLLLRETWLPMVGPLSVLGLWAAAHSTQVTTAWLLNAVGEARLLAKISAFVLALLIPGALVAAELGDITTVAWVVLGDAALSGLLLGLFADRRVGVSLAAQCRALAPIALACVAAWLATSAGVLLLEASHPAISLLLAAAAGATAYTGAVAVLAPGLLHSAALEARRTLGAEPAASEGS